LQDAESEDEDTAPGGGFLKKADLSGSSSSKQVQRTIIHIDEPDDEDDDVNHSREEDARLSQQLNDETLARALQDAEYGSSAADDDDDDDEGDGGGFLPADVAAKLRAAKSRQPRRTR
jgi:hypothetical protein